MPPQRHLLCFLFIHSFLSLKFNLLLTLSLSFLFFLFISSGFSFSFFCTLAMVFYSTHLFSFFIASLLILPCSFIFCCTSLCAAFLYVSPPFLSFRELSFIFHFLSLHIFSLFLLFPILSFLHFLIPSASSFFAFYSELSLKSIHIMTLTLLYICNDVNSIRSFNCCFLLLSLPPPFLSSSLVSFLSSYLCSLSVFFFFCPRPFISLPTLPSLHISSPLLPGTAHGGMSESQPPSLTLSLQRPAAGPRCPRSAV